MTDIQFTPEFIQLQRAIGEAAKLTPAEIKARPDGFLLKRAFIENSQTYYPAALDKIEQLQAKLATAERERDEVYKALESLTPGGSEFHHDTERCVEWVQFRMTELHQNQLKLHARLKEAERERDTFQEEYEKLQGIYAIVTRENAELRQALAYAATGENADYIIKQNGTLQKRLEGQHDRINDLARSLTTTGDRLEAAERVCQKAVTWAETRHTKCAEPDPVNCPGCKATGELVDELEKWYEKYRKQ